MLRCKLGYLTMSSMVVDIPAYSTTKVFNEVAQFLE